MRTTMRTLLVTAVLAVAAGGASGQTPADREARMRDELGLSEQQVDRLRTARRAHEDRMRDLRRRDEDLRRALAGQLRPGVAADQDSVTRLLDALGRLDASRAEARAAMRRDQALVLTPVQRARIELRASRAGVRRGPWTVSRGPREGGAVAPRGRGPGRPGEMRTRRGAPGI